MLSFIVPAHNEAELIGRTLTALHASVPPAEPYEIVVVDDASTDRTAAIARDHGTRVLQVNCRRIACVRNAGASAAAGELLFFVDADTVASARVVRAAVRALRRGACGGGAAVRFDRPVPHYAAILEHAVLPLALPLLRMAPGCFVFCHRRAYLAAGGFDEARPWAEEVAFCNRLKQQGRFVLLRETVTTSARKLRTHSALQLLRVGVELACGNRERLEYWYGQRAGEPVDRLATAAERRS